MSNQNCSMDQTQVQNAFLAAPPLISETLIDMYIKNPNWLRDIVTVEEWPRGNGTTMEQYIFRYRYPTIKRGFSSWRKLENNVGCAPGNGPHPSYNWEKAGGTAIQRKVISLMEKDLQSDYFDVKTIQTTMMFQQMFEKNVEGLYRWIDFEKEQNICFNALTDMAKKWVVDSGGPKFNLANPYIYPVLGTGIQISSLNIEILRRFYSAMRRSVSALPYDWQNGSPVYALECSPELLSRLYRDDPTLEREARFSSEASDILNKYNFITTIQGMFIPAPILYPRRFNADSAGNLTEVLPFLNDIPGEVGTFTDSNPLYEMTSFEEVLIHGKNPFKIFYLPTETTLGANSSFGPEFAWFNNWQWVNPLTTQDPGRRAGFFWSSATIGIAQEYSDSVHAILVSRPPLSGLFTAFPAPICPVTPGVCTNVIPAGSCPTPIITSFFADPTASVPTYFFNFSVALTDHTVGHTVQLGLDNGAYVTGTIAAVNAAFNSAKVTFAAGTSFGPGDHFTNIFNAGTLFCDSGVLDASDCRSNQTGDILVFLKRPIAAVTATNIVQVQFADGYLANMSVVSVNLAQNEWVLSYATGYGPTDDPTGAGSTVKTADALCDRGGVVKVCVPSATTATCSGCPAPTFVACS